MRIRHLLIVGLVLALGLVLMRLVVLEADAHEGRRLDQFQLDVERVSRDAASLAVLGQDFVLHRSAGARHRWHAVHASLALSLRSVSSYSAAFEHDIHTMDEVAQELPRLFEAIERAFDEPDAAKAQAGRDMLADHLVSETRRISDGAFELAEKLLDLRRARELANRRVTWLTMAAFALLVVAMAALVARRVLRPMVGLQAVARAVRGGDLGARSGYRANDEFGRLSLAVDEMTQTLHDRTTGLAKALRENESLLDTVRTLTIFSVADRDGRIVEVNDNFCAIAGYSREELIGQNHRIVNAAGQHPAFFWVDMWATITGGKPWRGEICNRRKDGSLYWVDSIIAPLAGADGTIDKYIAIRTDITAAKLAERQLRASKAVLDRKNEVMASILENLPCGLSVFDGELGLVASNSEYRRLLDFPDALFATPSPRFEDFIRHNARRGEYGEGDVEAIVQGIVERARRPAVPHRFERLRPNGMPVEVQGAPMPGGGFVTTYTDVSERKRAEIELLKATSLLRSVLDAATEVSIIATDLQLGITVFNAGAERLLGYTSAEVVGRLTPIVIHDENEVRLRGLELSEQLGRPVEGGAVFIEPTAMHEPREWTYVRKDGSHVAVSLVVTAMQDETGTIYGYLGIAHDVTRRKAYEQSLRTTMHAARRANLAKSQFLANMSHEIRTPMNAVIGLSYLLEQTGLNLPQRDYLSKINLASKSLLALINDILDLSKIEAGELTIERAPFRLDHLLKNLADVMRVQADAKGVAFEVDSPPGLPSGLDGDSTRLNQVLTNLLANAIKFTEHGGVMLVVRQVDAGADGARLRFTVQDSGIGIAPDVQAKLFEPFTQADTSMTRRFGGTGLGLSIVKRLASAMGGAFGLASTVNVGSEFWVELTFPLASADAFVEHAPVQAGQQSLPGARVLVVDDSDINLEVARRILELGGAQVSLACNGQEAVDKLRATPQAFDLVLMDVQMPVLDGYQATRRIRTELGLEDLPILALTAGALTSERRLADAAGMNDFIAKPFDPRALVLSVRRHVRRELLALPEPVASACEPTLPSGAAWPQIAGIDAADVSARLGGDAVLFRSILGRLLDEFGDDAVRPAMDDETGLAEHAGRMHKLKGGAGTLGMRAVHRLAGEAEAACRAGEAGLVSRCADELVVQLRALRTNAVPFLSTANDDVDAETMTDGAELDPQMLGTLAALLRKQSLAALDQFSAASVPLRRLLGKKSYELVRNHIDKLQFEDAARLLEEVTRP